MLPVARGAGLAARRKVADWRSGIGAEAPRLLVIGRVSVFHQYASLLFIVNIVLYVPNGPCTGQELAAQDRAPASALAGPPIPTHRHHTKQPCFTRKLATPLNDVARLVFLIIPPRGNLVPLLARACNGAVGRRQLYDSGNYQAVLCMDQVRLASSGALIGGKQRVG